VNDRARGTLLGLAVGDALGTTYEFAVLEQPAHPVLARGPATEIVGGGPFGLEAGQVTDDTQLAVCLAKSLAACGRLDADELAARYVAWAAHAFDIGNQTGASIGELERGTSPALAGLYVWRASERRPAGNGSLMRTAPIAVAYAARPIEELIDAALADSLITHADPRCALACAAFDAAIAGAIAGKPDLVAIARDALAKAEARLADAWRLAPSIRAPRPGETLRLVESWPATIEHALDESSDEVDPAAVPDEPGELDDPYELTVDLEHVASAAEDLRRDLDAALAESPGVYCPDLHLHRTAGFVRVAFRLAFWHAVHTPSWRDALVDVASRGGDADTNGAIAGALLGARDGAAAIPAAWVERVLAATQPGPPDWAEAHHPRHLLAL
jgi:ADP-ribosylglycohydrolase